MAWKQISCILAILLIQRPVSTFYFCEYKLLKMWNIGSITFNRFAIGTFLIEMLCLKTFLDLKHWKHCIYIYRPKGGKHCVYKFKDGKQTQTKFVDGRLLLSALVLAFQSKWRRNADHSVDTCWSWWWYRWIHTIQSLPLITDYKKVWWQSEYRGRGWWPLTQNMEVGRMKMRICQKEWCTAKETFLSRPAVSFRWLITTSPWWLWIQCIVLNIL